MPFFVALLTIAALVQLSARPAPAGGTPALLYDSPKGIDRGKGEPETWIANTLDAVIHVYEFRQFQGDFEDTFRRTLFRDRISLPYREDRQIGEPQFRPLTVKGAQAALSASFTNVNGGARREHLRAAVLASARIALVDISANSAAAFDRNQPSLSAFLRSLSVVEGHPSARSPLRVLRPPDARLGTGWAGP
jgi:hypothetical protein